MTVHTASPKVTTNESRCGGMPSDGPYRLQPLSLEQNSDWDQLIEDARGRLVFHSSGWLRYLASTRGADIRRWSIESGSGTIGFFCGGLLKKGPFRILGSPLTGWGTNALGPVFSTHVDSRLFLEALDTLATEERISTVEIESGVLSEEALEDAGFSAAAAWTYLVPLTPHEPDLLWRRIQSECRNRIRKAKRLGLTVELCDDPGFPDEYYDQYVDVMRRKGMQPHYPRRYPRSLYDELSKAGMLLALRVRDAGGRVLATGLFPHDHATLYLWGAASIADSLTQCPNDLLHWTAMQLASEKGIHTYNMSGHGRFKSKFGGALTLVKRWTKFYSTSARLARAGYRRWRDIKSDRRLPSSPSDGLGDRRRTEDRFIDLMQNPAAHLSARPAFRLADLWEAPLHHFPIRDEIIYGNLPLHRDMSLLEIGPGAGFTAFTLARHIHDLTLLDIAEGNISHLRSILGDFQNIKYLAADIGAPDLPRRMGRSFDAICAIEVFELVPDPATALKNMAAMLRRGGSLLLQFPNYAPPKNPGPTYFRTRAEFDTLMRAAGFEVWAVHGLRLRPYPELMVKTFLDHPLKLYRQFAQARATGTPLVYDQTWAFQHRHHFDRYKIALHTVWAVLLTAMRIGGRVFDQRLLGDKIFNKNLVVLAKR